VISVSFRLKSMVVLAGRAREIFPAPDTCAAGMSGFCGLAVDDVNTEE